MPAALWMLRDPIVTPRLVLRPFRAGDLPALAGMYRDPEVFRYLYDEPWSAEDVALALRRRIARRTIRAPGDGVSAAVVARESNCLVADLSLKWLSAEHRAAEVGFVVDPRMQGRGYATEAARALVAVAFGALGAHRVIGRLEARNLASARVLEKIGMRSEALLVENERVKGEWQSERVYAVLDHEWEAQTRASVDGSGERGPVRA